MKRHEQKTEEIARSMWKIRAQRTLARAYARLGQIERTLDLYQDLLATSEPVAVAGLAYTSPNFPM